MRIKFLTLLLAIVCAGGLRAQTEFAPLGATWYYSVADGNGNPLGSYEKYVSIADTIIDGKNCRLVVSPTDTIIFYSNNGKIYNVFRGHFLLTYDFGAKVGDTIAIDFRANKPYSFVTDTFYTVQCVVKKADLLINSNLKNYKLEMIPRGDLEGYTFGTYSYVENVGYEDVPMFKLTNFVSPGITVGTCYLRCYEDTNLKYTSDWWKQMGSTIPDYLATYLVREKVPSDAVIYWNTSEYAVNMEFFIDEYPTEKWNHPCRYVEFDDSRQESETTKDSMPPQKMDYWQKLTDCWACDYRESEPYHLRHFLPDSAQYITCFDGVVYNIAGDTIINGKKMKKVYTPYQYYAAIYEDTLNAKYYAVYNSSTKENLFMDFSVKEGDIVTISDDYNTVELKVMAVSFDKDGRKTINVKRGWTSVGWVEGIGDISHLLFSQLFRFLVVAETNASALARVAVGDNIVYERFTAADCESFEPYRYNSINQKNTNDDFSFYPNPANDYLLIDTETFECLTYEIISTSGAILQSGELLPSIDISSLPQGLKLIVVKDDNGRIVYSNKFIKQ